MKTRTCPCCQGPAYPLGGLGNLIWFRCRDCGQQFSYRPRRRAH